MIDQRQTHRSYVSLNKELSTFQKNNIQLFTIGEKDTLPNNCRKKLDFVIKETSENNGLKLVIALSYSSKAEIINSIKNIAQKVVDKTIKVDDINEAYFSNELYTSDYPDPDLLIRTVENIGLATFYYGKLPMQNCILALNCGLISRKLIF